VIDKLCETLRLAPAGLNESSLFWALKFQHRLDITPAEFADLLTLALKTHRIYRGENHRFYIVRKLGGPGRVLKPKHTAPQAWERKGK
jgi:hypothetical protein